MACFGNLHSQLQHDADADRARGAVFKGTRGIESTRSALQPVRMSLCLGIEHGAGQHDCLMIAAHITFVCRAFACLLS